MTGRIRAGTVVVELEQRIRGVVRLELDAHRDTLAELVDAELERVVSELVAERLGATNGAPRVNAKPQEPVRAGPETSLRDETPQAAAVEELCRKCGREPRLPGRRIGSRCKGKRDHARAIARSGNEVERAELRRRLDQLREN